MQQVTDSMSCRIQVLRGLATVAVVLIHNTPSGMAQVWYRPFINFSVGMFLFLSGLLSSMERWNPKKRILKVIIPYIIWTFIYVLIGNINNPEQIPIAYIESLITAKSAAVMYYVFVYCEFTLLTPLIDKLARTKFKWIGFVIAPIEIIIMRLIPLVSGYEVNKYTRIIMDISCLGWFSYFYLGYLLGNDYIQIKTTTVRLLIMWVGAIALQILEGYWYFSMGESNCGTQLKLTSILTGVLFCLLAYKYINTSGTPAPNILYYLGEYSFGIFFAHLAVMSVLNHITHYKDYVIYPVNAVVTIAITAMCVCVGNKILGKYAKYLAL